MHATPHALAGETVALILKGEAPNLSQGAPFTVEDWWDRVTGGSWMTADGNPAAIVYAFRAGMSGLPTDDEVVYGKVDGLGHIVHATELGNLV